MKKIRDDLWETRSYSPFPGLTTHAYLWRTPAGRNVLFYSVGTDDEFDDIAALGGVDHQYLSHQDEAGPMLAAVRNRFGATLHAPAAEIGAVEKFAEVHVPVDVRRVDANGIEVVPTPGHTPGSTSYVVPGVDGSTYLFTGDTVFVSAEGDWTAGYIRGMSDAEELRASLHLLAAVQPDLVVSSAYAGDEGAHAVDGDDWAEHARRAAAGIRA